MKTFTVVLSEGCNLDCTYCNVDKRSTRTIDPDLCIAGFNDLRNKFPTEEIKVDFFGGEPLIQFNMIKQLIAEFEQDGNVKFNIPTNGLLLTDGIVDYLIEHNVQVSLSFDGLWQDKNRLQITGKSTASKVLAKHDIAKRIPNLRIHTMVARGCYNLLENYLYIKQQFGINAELTLIRDVGTWTPTNVIPLMRGIDELFDWYANNPHEDMPYFILYYLRHFIKYHTADFVRKTCGAGESLFFFRENNVLPCTRFHDHPEMVAAIPIYAEMPECQTCSVKNYCEKGCLFEQIKNNGPIKELCTLYKHLYNQVSGLATKLQANQHFQNIITKEISNGITQTS